MNITLDDLTSSDVAAFLDEHIRDMKSVSPPESKHALDLEALRQPEIQFWIMREHGVLVACAALKTLTSDHGEIKSMRTATSSRKRGLGSRMLTFVLQQAEQKGFTRLSLETGSMAFFEPARELYKKFGFSECAPFGEYKLDPNSIFMTKCLQHGRYSTL